MLLGKICLIVVNIGKKRESRFVFQHPPYSIDFLLYNCNIRTNSSMFIMGGKHSNLLKWTLLISIKICPRSKLKQQIHSENKKLVSLLYEACFPR